MKFFGQANIEIRNVDQDREGRLKVDGERRQIVAQAKESRQMAQHFKETDNPEFVCVFLRIEAFGHHPRATHATRF